MEATKQTGAHSCLAGILVACAAVLGLAGSGDAAEWDAGGGERWQALLAKARQEGPAVIAGCPAQAAELSASFKRDTGLEANFLAGQTAQLESRFRLEAQAGRLTIDFRFGSPAELDLAKAGLLIDLNEALILPDVTNMANWADSRLVFVDTTRRHLLIGTQYVSGQAMINTALVDPSRLQKLDDLLRPEWKGKIAFYDPTNAGAGQTAAAYLADVKGVDFVKTLFDTQAVVLSRDPRQLSEWVARGTYPIAFGADTGELQSFRRQGVTALRLHSFADAPGSLTGGCSVISIPKAAPRSASATVFLNWYLSRAGQEAYVRAAQQPSRRLDVSGDGLPAEVIPVPGVAYLDQYREDWYWSVRPGLQAELRKALDK
ncbi:MAG: extracellular solute-binding protein [Bauldia sp.]